MLRAPRGGVACHLQWFNSRAPYSAAPSRRPRRSSPRRSTSSPSASRWQRRAPSRPRRRSARRHGTWAPARPHGSLARSRRRSYRASCRSAATHRTIRDVRDSTEALQPLQPLHPLHPAGIVAGHRTIREASDSISVVTAVTAVTAVTDSISVATQSPRTGTSTARAIMAQPLPQLHAGHYSSIRGPTGHPSLTPSEAKGVIAAASPREAAAAAGHGRCDGGRAAGEVGAARAARRMRARGGH